jgi:hypothetical protein
VLTHHRTAIQYATTTLEAMPPSWPLHVDTHPAAAASPPVNAIGWMGRLPQRSQMLSLASGRHMLPKASCVAHPRSPGDPGQSGVSPQTLMRLDGKDSRCKT